MLKPTIIYLILFFHSNKFHTASWYGKQFHGRKTASGEIYNKWKMTCASNYYRLGDSLKVTNIKNGKSVIVRVNDRMHPKYKKRIDLSRGAFEQIANLNSGVIKVNVEKL